MNWLIYYILGFGTGYIIGGIVSNVKRRVKEYPVQQAMQTQQSKYFCDLWLEKENK